MPNGCAARFLAYRPKSNKGGINRMDARQSNNGTGGESLTELALRLQRIESLLEGLKMPEREKHFYTIKEAAKRLELSPWYVRKLCAEGLILAENHPQSGRFLISADELTRIESRRDALDD